MKSIFICLIDLINTKKFGSSKKGSFFSGQMIYKLIYIHILNENKAEFLKMTFDPQPKIMQNSLL